MRTLLIANPKGGCGKTTLSANIAGYPANRGQHVALIDMDGQRSAAMWVATHPEEPPPVRTLKYDIDQDSPFDWLATDPAAGLSSNDLVCSLTAKTGQIIAPFIPSLFDLPHYIAERELEQWVYLQSWLEYD